MGIILSMIGGLIFGMAVTTSAIEIAGNPFKDWKLYASFLGFVLALIGQHI